MERMLIKECRCKKCKKLLCKLTSRSIIENNRENTIEIKCQRCNDINIFELLLKPSPLPIVA